ncbi:hypothetical protein B0H13DRAFT_2656198 [Mycena leptocephala]|nr:hypothetical protein B0H13DRAFT_2656198 [Mycena leptocephala]
MLTELQVAKNQTRQAGLACKTEKMARIAAEDELHTLKDDLEAREAKIRTDEEEILKYREAMEDDLKRTIRRMQDNAERHTRRLSTDRQVGVSTRPRPFPLDEPPAKCARVQEPAGSGARVLTECEQRVRIPTELGAPLNPFNTTMSSSAVTSTQSAIVTDTSSTSPSAKSEILPQISSSSSNVKASAPETAVRRSSRTASDSKGSASTGRGKAIDAESSGAVVLT